MYLLDTGVRQYDGESFRLGTGMTKEAYSGFQTPTAGSSVPSLFPLGRSGVQGVHFGKIRGSGGSGVQGVQGFRGFRGHRFFNALMRNRG